MRPVNLIPPEERRGDRAPLRAGSLSYLIVAGLALALVAVVVTVMTQNNIAEQESAIAILEVREAEAREEADRLAPYAQFSSVSDARTATVTSLAQSRFDWYRVLRELSLVIPDDIALTVLTGSVSPAVAVGDDDSSLRAESLGPALSMTGCASGHDAVAGFIEDLKDIDGVTRAAVTNSTISDDTPSEGDATGTADECEGKDLAGFSAVAVFDGVTVPGAGAAPPITPPAEPSGSSAPADPAVADAKAEQQEGRDSIGTQSDESREATNLIPGVAR